MTIAQLFRKFFGPVEREAGIVAAHVEADAHSAVQLAEKELAMPFDIQVISGALSRLEATLSSSSDQSATITGLQGQVSDLTAKLAAANSDTNALLQDLTDIQAKLVALSPDPAAQPAQ